MSGAVGGAISGFGIDLALALAIPSGGLSLILAPILGAAGNVASQVISESKWVDIDYVNIMIGALFNTMGVGLSALANKAFTGLCRGTQTLERELFLGLKSLANGLWDTIFRVAR